MVTPKHRHHRLVINSGGKVVLEPTAVPDTTLPNQNDTPEKPVKSANRFSRTPLQNASDKTPPTTRKTQDFSSPDAPIATQDDTDLDSDRNIDPAAALEEFSKSLHPKTWVRLKAVQAAYEVDIGDHPGEKVIRRHVTKQSSFRRRSNDTQRFTDLCREYINNPKEIDDLLENTLTPSNWSLGRLDAVVKAILRIAVAEMRLSVTSMSKSTSPATSDTIHSAGTIHSNIIETNLTVPASPETEHANKPKPRVSHSVVVKEYLQVADAFFDGDEVNIINGVLDAAVRQLYPSTLFGEPHV